MKVKIKIKRAFAEPFLDEHKLILNKYNASYEEYNDYNQLATIEVQSAEEIFQLMRELDEDLILNKYEEEPTITIYDDFIE